MVCLPARCSLAELVFCASGGQLAILCEDSVGMAGSFSPHQTTGKRIELEAVRAGSAGWAGAVGRAAATPRPAAGPRRGGGRRSAAAVAKVTVTPRGPASFLPGAPGRVLGHVCSEHVARRRPGALPAVPLGTASLRRAAGSAVLAAAPCGLGRSARSRAALGRVLLKAADASAAAVCLKIGLLGTRFEFSDLKKNMAFFFFFLL